jgi:hypothetical protein
MGPADKQLSVENPRQQEKKKAYRKPSVQAYGTLTEVTKSGSGTHTLASDGWHTRT